MALFGEEGLVNIQALQGLLEGKPYRNRGEDNSSEDEDRSNRTEERQDQTAYSSAPLVEKCQHEAETKTSRIRIRSTMPGKNSTTATDEEQADDVSFEEKRQGRKIPRISTKQRATCTVEDRFLKGSSAGDLSEVLVISMPYELPSSIRIETRQSAVLIVSSSRYYLEYPLKPKRSTHGEPAMSAKWICDSEELEIQF